MLLIQTGQAKRLRKFAILTLLGMMTFMSGWGLKYLFHPSRREWPKSAVT